jgi:hypothetical protein
MELILKKYQVEKLAKSIKYLTDTIFATRGGMEVIRQEQYSEVLETLERNKAELMRVLNTHGWDYKNNQIVKIQK